MGTFIIWNKQPGYAGLLKKSTRKEFCVTGGIERKTNKLLVSSESQEKKKHGGSKKGSQED